MAACLVCFDDLELNNTVFYYPKNDGGLPSQANDPQWKICKFCSSCLQTLIDSQFEKFVSDCLNASCLRSIRRLMERGPPIYVHDEHAFPEAVDNSPIYIKGGRDGGVKEAVLKNAKIGNERQELWDELKRLIQAQQEPEQ